MVEVLNLEEVNVLEESSNSKFPKASVSSVLHVLNHILPNVNKLLEDNIIKITESFSNIAQSSVQLEKMLDAGDIDSAKKLTDGISKNVTSAIVGLQFQDRVSQNLTIATESSADINNAFSKIFGEGEIEVGEDEMVLLKEISSKIFLGEIRDEYIKFLLKRTTLKDPAEIDPSFGKEENVQGENEIELF